MNIDLLINEIQKDGEIDKHNLDVESLKTCSLHNKYYSLMMSMLVKHKKLEQKYNELLKDKTEYYLGKSPDSVYRENPLFHKILKQDLELYINSDKELQAISLEKFELKTCIEFVESFIKTINNRTFQISNAINFIKFKNGQV